MVTLFLTLLRCLIASWVYFWISPPPLCRDVLLRNRIVAAVAAKHGKTPAQVLIRWSLQAGFVCIPKSATPGKRSCGHVGRPTAMTAL